MTHTNNPHYRPLGDITGQVGGAHLEVAYIPERLRWTLVITPQMPPPGVGLTPTPEMVLSVLQALAAQILGLNLQGDPVDLSPEEAAHLRAFLDGTAKPKRHLHVVPAALPDPTQSEKEDK